MGGSFCYRIGTFIDGVRFFAGFLPGAYQGATFVETLVRLLLRTSLPADGQAPAHATAAAGYSDDASHYDPHQYGVVYAAIAPVVGVVVGCDGDVDCREVVDVVLVEVFDQLLSLCRGVAVFDVFDAVVGLGDLATGEAGGGSAVEVVGEEGL